MNKINKNYWHFIYLIILGHDQQVEGTEFHQKAEELTSEERQELTDKEIVRRAEHLLDVIYEDDPKEFLKALTENRDFSYKDQHNLGILHHLALEGAIGYTKTFIEYVKEHNIEVDYLLKGSHGNKMLPSAVAWEEAGIPELGCILMEQEKAQADREHAADQSKPTYEEIMKESLNLPPPHILAKSTLADGP